MSVLKRVLNPERLRQVPEHFSWLDHRLVREHYIERADVCAWALYLFLLGVADVHGLSYYSEPSGCVRSPSTSVGSTIAWCASTTSSVPTCPPGRCTCFCSAWPMSTA